MELLVFSLSTEKTLAWNLHLRSSQPAGISSPSCGGVPGTGCAAQLSWASGQQLRDSSEGRRHGEIFGCLPLPRAPFAFSLSLFLLVWGFVLTLSVPGGLREPATPPPHTLASHLLAASRKFPLHPRRCEEEGRRWLRGAEPRRVRGGQGDSKRSSCLPWRSGIVYRP